MNGRTSSFWLPYLVLMSKFEPFIPWRLENRDVLRGPGSSYSIGRLGFKDIR